MQLLNKFFIASVLFFIAVKADKKPQKTVGQKEIKKIVVEKLAEDLDTAEDRIDTVEEKSDIVENYEPGTPVSQGGIIINHVDKKIDSK